MSKVDEELARALDEMPEPVAPPQPYAPPRTTPAQPMNKSLGLLIALLAIVGIVVAVFMFGFKEAAIYAISVDELSRSGAQYNGRKIRLQGELVPGSLQRRDSPCEYKFSIRGFQEKDKSVEVRYAQCVVPDGFRDAPGGGVEVTVEGTLADPANFQATLVMAKCSSKYDPATHQMGDKPKGAIPNN